MTRIKIKYQVKFDSPFHAGNGLSEGLLDRTVIKDKDGYLYIPGSTIKGILRENCEYLAKLFISEVGITDPHDEQMAVDSLFKGPNIIETLFGSRFKESSLFFDPATLPWDAKEFFDNDRRNGSSENNYLFMQTEKRTQTAISRRTGAAKENALYTSEAGISTLKLNGKIHGHIGGIRNEMSELPGPYALFLLVAGIAACERIGGNRSTGLGKCSLSIDKFLVNGESQQPDSYLDELDTIMLYEDAKEGEKA